MHLSGVMADTLVGEGGVCKVAARRRQERMNLGPGTSQSTESAKTADKTKRRSITNGRVKLPIIGRSNGAGATKKVQVKTQEEE